MDSLCGTACNARDISEHGLATARGRLAARLGRLKVCGGNRTRKGADTQQVLASVVRTARLQ